MKTYEVWYFIGGTEFYEIAPANNAEEARLSVKNILAEIGYPEGSLFIDAVVEVGQ